ncbi:MAG: NUDIX domain-containing protein [Deltaproteobacteria bacterium]|nr:NUDIX domain-containing protein [Deltaproteobacteria bacterium]
MNPLPLRPNVCMLIFNADHKLWLGERLGEPGIWQFPQGGVQSSVPLEENVYREIEEELGLKRPSVEIVRKLQATHEYEFQRPPDYAKDKWRGQKQTFWLVRFLGSDAEIDLNTHEAEFMNWKWCTPAEIRQFAEPKRLGGYEKPLQEFEAFLALGA